MERAVQKSSTDVATLGKTAVIMNICERSKQRMNTLLLVVSNFQVARSL